MPRLLRFAAAVSAIAASAACAQDFSKAEVTAVKITDTVHMLQGVGGNIGVSVGEDMVFVVDDQYAPMTPKIEAAIRKLTPKPVQFVLNTHWHGDHTGGNENMAKASAVIVAHENVRKRMNSEQFIELMKMKVPPSPKAALPVVTFAQSISFHLNGEEIRVVHAPRAHTDGDAIVHFTGSDVVHMGDIYFNGMYPFIDASSGGTVEGVIAACDQVLGMITDKTKVIPGHGALSNRAELKAYRDMLSEVRARFQKALGEGKSADDVMKAGLTRDLDEKWGKGFIKPDTMARMMAGLLRK